MREFEFIAARCEAIEECYEFMLGYAAQGVLDERESRSGAQLRELLTRAVEAAASLAGVFSAAIEALELAPRPRYEAFLEVLRADAAKALAAMELVLAQPGISSQMVDNLNASHHVRTLLTDVFLLDEILAAQKAARENAGGR